MNSDVDYVNVMRLIDCDVMCYICEFEVHVTNISLHDAICVMSLC